MMEKQENLRGITVSKVLFSPVKNSFATRPISAHFCGEMFFNDFKI